MAAKPKLIDAATGTITPGVGNNTFTVSNWDTPVGLVAEFSNTDDFLTVVRRNIDDSGWEPATNGKGIIQLHTNQREVAIDFPDTYALMGSVSGYATVGKVEV